MKDDRTLQGVAVGSVHDEMKLIAQIMEQHTVTAVAVEDEMLAMLPVSVNFSVVRNRAGFHIPAAIARAALGGPKHIKLRVGVAVQIRTVSYVIAVGISGSPGRRRRVEEDSWFIRRLAQIIRQLHCHDFSVRDLEPFVTEDDIGLSFFADVQGSVQAFPFRGSNRLRSQGLKCMIRRIGD